MTDHRATEIPVSIGVCAYNEAGRVRLLLDSLLTQRVAPPFHVVEVLVVASGCTDGTDAVVRQCAETDPRIRLIREPERLGKASALNRILAEYAGELLVLVNADARLAADSISHLLAPFNGPSEIQVACGAAVPEARPGIPILVEEVLWDLHNRILDIQSRRNRDNHCCDELMAMRRGFVDSLPPNLINDGAYVGVMAALSGHTVRFCEQARVWVRTPQTVRGLLERRRRILRGHRQVRQLLLRAPSTLETLSLREPGIVARILARGIRDRPVALPVLLLLAFPLELLSGVLAAADGFRRMGYQAVWPKVDSL